MSLVKVWYGITCLPVKNKDLRLRLWSFFGDYIFAMCLVNDMHKVAFAVKFLRLSILRFHPVPRVFVVSIYVLFKLL